jgi:hypothetical protein
MTHDQLTPLARGVSCLCETDVSLTVSVYRPKNILIQRQVTGTLLWLLRIETNRRNKFEINTISEARNKIAKLDKSEKSTRLPSEPSVG